MNHDETDHKSPENDAVFPDSVAKHNMRNGIIHGAFFNMATAFADPFTVFPLFLAGFTQSRTIIGLVVSLIQAVGVIPQIAMARQIRRNPGSARRFMLAGIWTRGAVWGVIAVGILFLPMHDIGIFVLFVLLVSVYSLGGGIAVLPFKQVISGTIPPERRSTFFGWRLVTGGILATLAGVATTYILGNKSLKWPQNYGVLFGLSFIGLIVAYVAMSRFIFPKSTRHPPTAAPIPLRRELGIVRRDYPILKRLIAVRLLSSGLPLVLPFLALYATNEIHIPLAWVGIYIASQKAGQILSSLAWMPLGNRLGTRSVILSGIGLSILSLAVILFFKTPATITLAFALAGSGASALTVGFSGYILELGVPEIRPMLFALEGTLLMPSYFMPVLGGWLADEYGYSMIVKLGLVLLFSAFLLSITLCEPRRDDMACGPTVL